MPPSKIFAPCRALGFVSNHVPLQVRYIERRKEHLITTCVGKSFHTYGISHFGLLSVSGLHPCDIECMAADQYHVYTGAGPNIYAWRRGREIKHIYKGHEHDVKLLLPFGPHLISVDKENYLKIWDIKDESLYSELCFSKDYFHITALCHPEGHINKILLGSEQGDLQMLNLAEMNIIYRYKGWQSTITCISNSTAIDVVAIGLKNGNIVIHDLVADMTIMTLKQEWGAVSSISFRRDGKPIMASGSITGHIVLWDLEKRRVASQVMKAHEGPVTGMVCLPSEPLMLTSSPDNRLQLWVFDMPDDGARLLRIREGHSAPLTHIRFYDDEGHNVLSASNDSTLRIFNTRTEQFNKSLGKASNNRKATKRKKRTDEDPHIMPPITQFTFETTREKDWHNIVAIHSDLSMTSMWSYDKLRMGQLKLFPERLKNVGGNVKIVARCLCMTRCGNFVIIGYNTGHVDRFNMQSGIWKGNYGVDRAHDCSVCGVEVDKLNSVTITGSIQGEVIFWQFKKGSNRLHKLDLEESIKFFRINREDSMLAIAMEDFTINIVDIDAKRLVRRLNGHGGAVTDLTFSPDCRWLISSSMDCSVKVWDVPSSALVDQFATHTPCSSLDMSPTGGVLATTHRDSLGVFLWTNRTVMNKITLKAIDSSEKAELIELPDHTAMVEEEFIIEDEDEQDTLSPEQISKELVTFSGLSISRWANLLDLEKIKEKNKMKMPKAPVVAPFFLPTIPSLETRFDVTSSTEENVVQSKIINPRAFQNYTVFGNLLNDSIQTNNFDAVLTQFKSFGPSLIDFEIKSLAGYVDLMEQFLKFIDWMFSTNMNYDIASSYYSLFLKYYMDVVNAEERLRDMSYSVDKRLSEANYRLEDNVLFCLGTMEMLKNI